MSTLATAYLRKLEWSLGNCQCPSCRASRPGDECAHSEFVGHEPGCELALALQELGAGPEWQRPNSSEKRKLWLEQMKKVEISPLDRAVMKHLMGYDLDEGGDTE